MYIYLLILVVLHLPSEALEPVVDHIFIHLTGHNIARFNILREDR